MSTPWDTMSLYRLAQLTGIHPSKLSQYRRGLVEPRLRQLRRIAAALGCSPVELLPRDAAVVPPGALSPPTQPDVNRPARRRR